MSTEKFSPQLLRSILESDGIDTSDLDGMPTLTSPEQPFIQTLEPEERKRALKQLALLISQFRSASGSPDDVLSLKLDELPDILRLLAELAAEAKADDKNREEKKKVLHVAAAMLRRMLHMPDANHYRVLGLKVGASPEQIAEHYQLLHQLFWFDEAIDPQRKSRLRISEAYTVLKEPESRYRYDEDLAWLEQQALRSVTGSQGGGLWRIVAAALLVILGLTGVLLYFDKTSDTEIASLPEKNIQSQPVVQPERTPTSPVGEAPVVAGVAEPKSPDTGLESSEKMVSASAGDVVKSSEPQVSTKQVVAEVEPEVPAIVSQPPRKATDFAAENEKPIAPPVVTRFRESVQEKKHTRAEKTFQAQDDSGFMSRQPPVRKYDISRSEKPAPVPAKKKTDDALSVAVKTPPATQFPETPLVISPRVDMPQIDDSALNEPSEQPPALTAIPVPTEAPPAPPIRQVEPTMVVIGSPGLSVDYLTEKQVRAIFLGNSSRLPSGERVTVVAPQGSSSLKTAFYRNVIGKTPRQFKIHWAKMRFQGKRQLLQHLADDEAVKEKVAHSSSVIGIVKSTAVDDSVKVLLDTGH